MPPHDIRKLTSVLAMVKNNHCVKFAQLLNSVIYPTNFKCCQKYQISAKFHDFSNQIALIILYDIYKFFVR